MMEECPYCDGSADDDIIESHMKSEDQWNFSVVCTHCKKRYGVEAEVSEYEYTVYEMNEDAQVADEKDVKDGD